MLIRHGITAFVALLSLSLIIFLLHLYKPSNASATGLIESFAAKGVHPCPDQLEWLKPLDLTYPIRYAQRDIVVKPTSGAKRLSLTKVSAPLFPNFQTIDLTDTSKAQLRNCKEPLFLDIPQFTKDVDASHISIGISTTIKRLEDSIPSLLRWLKNTHAKLYVIIIENDKMPEGAKEAFHPADPKRVADVQKRMRDSGIDVTIVQPLAKHDYFSQRYFSLVRVMYKHRDPKTKWLALADDDTFFLSMSSLVDTLSAFNTSQPHYVGALSEDWWSVTRYGLMAFGGAGIFLSLPLAEAIDAKYDDCQERSKTSAGDIRLRECIYWHTQTKLTSLRALHQVDIDQDLSGLYESGQPILSLHHWKGRGPDGKGYRLPTMHLVADVCGGTCFLQRWQFGKDMVLTNGFSVATYPKDHLKRMEVDKMEETWGEPTAVEGSFNRGTDHSLGPTRPKLKLGEEKIQYLLLDSAVTESGVRQTYFRSGAEGELDTVLDLHWVDRAQAVVPG
ncbi:MAG: hypothetical protein LQ351_002349 [Letrouitia transgressa]|nr:MAG: hypothetical protein LQ351_002349 [Letrouitia transgressa]